MCSSRGIPLLDSRTQHENVSRNDPTGNERAGSRMWMIGIWIEFAPMKANLLKAIIQRPNGHSVFCHVRFSFMHKSTRIVSWSIPRSSTCSRGILSGRRYTISPERGGKTFGKRVDLMFTCAFRGESVSSAGIASDALFVAWFNANSAVTRLSTLEAAGNPVPKGYEMCFSKTGKSSVFDVTKRM